MKTLQKMAWMPCLSIGKLLLISLLGISLSSCHKIVEETTFYKIFTYKNKSTHDIKIIAYLSVGGFSEVEYLIKSNKELKQRLTLGDGPPSPLTTINHADSVKVIFDSSEDSKISKFINPLYGASLTNKFNILNTKNHSRWTQGDTHYSDYTFTIADYNNAK